MVVAGAQFGGTSSVPHKFPALRRPFKSRIMAAGRDACMTRQADLSGLRLSKGGGMVDRDERHRLIRASAWALLMVSGFTGVVTATEQSDSRLPDAAREQDAKAVRALLAQKAQVNTRSSDGSTALLWLAHWNDLDTADLLLRAGADAN